MNYRKSANKSSKRQKQKKPLKKKEDKQKSISESSDHKIPTRAEILGLK